MSCFAIVGCSGGRVIEDTNPPFHLDPDQPFRLDFGRGSGWHGLDTIKIDETGGVVLHRMKDELRKDEKGDIIVLSWETTTLRLQPDALAEVRKAVESNALTKLHKKYYVDRVADGSQWVLWLRQGGREKSSFFSNYFPPAIKRFAKELDRILEAAGLGNAEWHPIPPEESGVHDKDLWQSSYR
jgi:hypothetical protein